MRSVSLVVALLTISAASLVIADELEEYNPNWTIHELAGSVSVPVKSLAAVLGLDVQSDAGTSLSSLGVSRKDAEDAISEYREGESTLVGTLVVLGMAIVFVSLVLVASLISLFKHMHVFDKDRSGRRSRTVKSVIGTITSDGDLGERSIAAVVAAIFLHEKHVDAENRLLLTWKRAATSAWKTVRPMPNESYFASKRGS